MVTFSPTRYEVRGEFLFNPQSGCQSKNPGRPVASRSQELEGKGDLHAPGIVYSEARESIETIVIVIISEGFTGVRYGSHFASLRLELQRRLPSDLRSLSRRRCWTGTTVTAASTKGQPLPARRSVTARIRSGFGGDVRALRRDRLRWMHARAGIRSLSVDPSARTDRVRAPDPADPHGPRCSSALHGLSS